MVCVRDRNGGCSGDVGDGGEELTGLKKLVKGKICNQCKATNKQKKWGYSTKWMPDG